MVGSFRQERLRICRGVPTTSGITARHLGTRDRQGGILGGGSSASHRRRRLDPSVRTLAHDSLSSSRGSAWDPPWRHLLRELALRNPVYSCEVCPAPGHLEILLAQLAPTSDSID